MPASRHPGARTGRGAGPQGDSKASGRDRKVGRDAQFDEQTTIDPLAKQRARAATGAPKSASRGSPGELATAEITQNQVIADSGEIILDPASIEELPVRAPVLRKQKNSTGISEVSGTGGTIDELTMAEEAHAPPQLALLNSPNTPITGRHPSPPTEAIKGWLSVKSGADRGRRFPLPEGKCTVGRSMDNGIVLSDIAVSRRHLTVENRGDSFVLTDLGSGNGTLVNDEDENGTYRLKHGDKLELGNTVMLFEAPTLPTMQAAQALSRGKSKAPDLDEMNTVAGRKSPVADAPPRPPQKRATSHPPLPPPSEPRGLVDSSNSRNPPLDASKHPPLQASPPSSDFLPKPVANPIPGPSAPVGVGVGHPNHQSGQSNGGLVQSGSGFSPYPAPPAYPGQGYGSSAQHPPPNFQYPDGVMAPAQSGDSRKLLYGILIIAFIAVGAGIIMAVAHGGGGSGEQSAATTDVEGAESDTPEGADGAATKAVEGATTDDSTTDDSTTDDSTTDDSATATDDSATATDDSATATDDSTTDDSATATDDSATATDDSATATDDSATATDDSATATDDSAIATDDSATATDDSATATDDSATATDDSATDDSATDDSATAIATTGTTAPVSLAMLYAHEVSPDTFGTNEDFLRDVPTPTPGMGDPNPGVEDKDDKDDKAVEKVAKTDPRKSTRKNDESTSKPDRQVDADAARRKAEDLYTRKNFSGGASVLREAADGVRSASEAKSLRTLAGNYEKIGRYLATNEQDAPAALRAFKNAHRLDERYGDGIHDRFIGVKIGTVAPKAAASYMAKKQYADANSAASSAERFGGGDSVKRVRSSLQSKAEKLYQDALAASKGGDKKKAAALAREAMSMVPKSNAVYSKARKLAGR